MDKMNNTTVSQNVEMQAFNWLTGYWRGQENNMELEELWMPPKGNIMLGLHRDVFDSSQAFFEYLRIEKTDSGFFYIASPFGQVATSFKLTKHEFLKAIFENPLHDYPQIISYWIDNSGFLHAQISGKQNGVTKAKQWKFQRQSFNKKAGF